MDELLEAYDGFGIPRYLCEEPEFKTLKKNKKNLTDDEREEVSKLGAEWSDGRSAIFRSDINGKTWYCTHTHRTYGAAPTIKGAAKKFHDYVKDSS